MRKNNQTGRILIKCSSDAKMFSSDVYKKHTQARKYQADGLQYGRSMVEMLGVLAIIGVLSVGAIAGYQKAMFKYKMNKFTVSFNQLVNNIIQLKPKLDKAYNNTSLSNEILNQLNLIPDGLKYNSSDNSIYDIFNSKITFHYGMTRNTDGRYFLESYISYTLDYANNMITLHGSNVCQNILNIAKENSANITYIGLQHGKGTQVIEGDYSCKNKSNCLKYLNMIDIENYCFGKSAENKLGLVIYLLATGR